VKVPDQRLCCLAAFDEKLISKADLDACLAELDQLDPASDSECILLQRKLLTPQQFQRIVERFTSVGSVAAEDDREATDSGTELKTEVMDVGGQPHMQQPAIGGDPSHAANRVGKYEIIREVGRGGMAIVYEARDTVLDMRVALKKIVRPGLLVETDSLRNAAKLLSEDASEAAAAAVSEARQAVIATHKNVVRVHDVFVHDNTPYVAMEFIDGQSLRELIASEMLSTIRALKIIRDVARGLGFAHSRGVVHRDVKPGNIMVGRYGTVITDFGLAHRIPLGAGDDTRLPVVGTPPYMPPEQASGLPPDPRSDTYSLGAVLYHCVAGRPPYEGSGQREIIDRVTHTGPPSLDKIVPNLHAGITLICSKAMSRGLSGRYQTCDELVADIDAQIWAGHRFALFEAKAAQERSSEDASLTASSGLPSVGPYDVTRLITGTSAWQLYEARGRVSRSPVIIPQSVLMVSTSKVNVPAAASQVTATSPPAGS